MKSLCAVIPDLEVGGLHHVQSGNHADVTGTAQLETLNRIIPNLVGDKPDSVCTTLNGICFDLELYDSEIMEDISARHVENDRRVNRYPEDIGVCVIVRISENPVELMTSDVESWAALSCDLSLIVGGNTVTPCGIWWTVREKRVHRGKRRYYQNGQEECRKRYSDQYVSTVTS